MNRNEALVYWTAAYGDAMLTLGAMTADDPDVAMHWARHMDEHDRDSTQVSECYLTAFEQLSEQRKHLIEWIDNLNRAAGKATDKIAEMVAINELRDMLTGEPSDPRELEKIENKRKFLAKIQAKTESARKELRDVDYDRNLTQRRLSFAMTMNMANMAEDFVKYYTD